MTERPDLGLFSHAVVMTLDKRLASGELGDAADRFAAAGLPVSRFLVGDGTLFPAGEYGWIDQDAQPRRQAFNYASAFQRILAYAAVPRWCRPFLYLEDDAQLVSDAFEVLPLALKEFEGVVRRDAWDLLYIGGNHVNGRVERVSEYLMKPEYSLDLHCLGINHTAIGKLRAIQPSAHCTIDGVIADMQQRGELRAYAVNPPVCYQKPGHSYNENRYDNKILRQLVKQVW